MGNPNLPKHSPATSADATSAVPRRILIADDDVALRRALTIALQADGHEVVEAGDAATLLKILDNDALPIDLVLTDVCMPGGLNGLHALEIMRRLPAKVRCMVMSAFADPDVRGVAKRLGAVAVFDKPFDIEALRSEVNELWGEPRLEPQKERER